MISPSVILFAELDEVLDKLKQGPPVSQQQQRATDTTDTSGEETDTSQPRRRVRSKRTFKMKKSYATSELARFFVTGPTDASTKLSEFYCRLCRKDVSVLTHGSSEVLRHFQGIRHFARDQRLRLETPGWRVLGFDGKPLTEDELERQREKILRAPLLVPDREYPYREDLIPDASGNTDPQFPVLAKVSSLVDVLQLGGSYELVERLWERFVLTASRVNVSVTWSRNEVLVSSVCPPEHMCRLFVTDWINYLFQSIILNGMFPRILDRVFEWVKAHKQFGLEFEDRGSRTWVFVKTWRRNSFSRVAVGVIDRYLGDANSELVILGQVLCAIGSGASLVSIYGGSHTLVESYKEYLGSRCMRGVLDYPTFDVRLLKRCLQKTASTVFGTLDPFSVTEFMTRLKGAEHRDWMQARQSLRGAIETGDLSLPGLVDVVSNIIGVWPLVVSYLKEAGKKDSGDSLVVWFSPFSFCFGMTTNAFFRFHV